MVSRFTDLVELNVTSSSGFYVRSLAFDLGEALGCGAHIQELRRTAIKDYQVADALSYEQLLELEEQNDLPLMPIDSLLMELPALNLNEEQHRRLLHGQTYQDANLEEGKYRLYSPQEQIFAVGFVNKDGELKTEKVFVL